ncbi:AAA family ATPase [Paenibacillus protaetiae]|uniref:Adenylyl-sulfate kinase n=1 Tax=Paenibacillus protaetiae TaxID=2509456 RepID=A0A4P6ETP4_9BACL|nr:AAA family ATPase [Paenibacillus protaetiae]QAY65825.1 adenylyl-sulfate kinase [Paenibacillus protaetiae]
MLYIFSGLPGTGKSTLSAALAAQIKAVYLRVDAVEQAMRDIGMKADGPEGYYVCYALAAQNLRLGLDVIADTVNPIRITREAWRGVAASAGAPFAEIEVVCTDVCEHKQRVETRTADIPGLVLPTWEEVINRHYEEWDRDRIKMDTAHKTAAETLTELCGQLHRYRMDEKERI